MDVSKHLEKASEAVRKKNFDYAINLYHQVLTLKPDHGDARRELRQALLRRSEYKKIPPFIALLQGLHHRVGIVFGKLFKNSGQVIGAAEGYLRNDPRNRGVNRALAEALENAGHARSAVAVWEFLGEDEQIGDYALKRAGALYYGQKQLEQALGCYQTVLERSPRDSEAEKMRKNLAAEGVLSSGSYDPNKSSRDLARDKDTKRHLESEKKIVTTEDERALVRQRLEEAVAAAPSDKRARKNLIEHHVKAREYDAAVEVLEAGIELDPEAFDLRDRLGDVRILDLERQLREATALASKGDAAAETDLVDITREKLEFETEEFTRRVQEHPTDLDLRFRLGRLLLEDEKVDAAIECFQASVKDPRRRIDSLLGLGRAFEHNGMLDLSRKQLEAALAEVDGTTERATEISYSLAVLLERMGDEADARARYESIYEKNIHYQDVAERLERLRSSEPTSPKEAAPSEEPPAPPASEASKTETNDAGDAQASSDIYDFKD